MYMYVDGNQYDSVCLVAEVMAHIDTIIDVNITEKLLPPHWHTALVSMPSCVSMLQYLRS